MAEQEVHVYTFPIACLQTGKPINEDDRDSIMEICFSWHVWNYAKDADLEDNKIWRRIEVESERQYKIEAGNLTDPEARLVYGLSMAGAQVDYSLKEAAINYATRHNNVRSAEGGSHVLVPKKTYWMMRESWTYREFAVCCAVWAALGDSEYRPIPYDKIAYHAIGYTNRDVMLAAGKDIPVLSRDQLRWTIAELERRQMFCCTPMHSRAIAYSRQLKLEELIQRVGLEMKSRKRFSTPAKSRLAKVNDIANTTPS